MKSQNQQILKYLQSGKKITPLEALNKFGCFRLGARIYDLRHDGHPISSKPFKTDSGKTVAIYELKTA